MGSRGKRTLLPSPPPHSLPIALAAPSPRALQFDSLPLPLSLSLPRAAAVSESVANSTRSLSLSPSLSRARLQCEGHCEELNDPKGLLPSHLLGEDKLDSKRLDGVTLDECAKFNSDGRKTLWSCNKSPKMLHHGNIDTATGQYLLGNVFAEQTIHARNRYFDFISVYGSLDAGQPFGFRYSGHHFDLSFTFDADGALTDLPTFLGHNPLIVPKMAPAVVHDDGNTAVSHEDYLQWRNMAGVPQFPDAVKVIIEAAAVLDEHGYVPLPLWDSTPSTGGLTLKGSKDMLDMPHIDLAKASDAEFEALWNLIDYTLEFPRGARARPEKAEFRKSGRLCWTTVVHRSDKTPVQHLPHSTADLVNARQFFYVRAETDELLYFGMVNSLFSLMLESEPSNHLHSILIPKAYLA